MASFNDIFGNFLFLALFIFAGVSLIVIIQAENGAPQPLQNEAVFNNSFSDLSTTLTELDDTAGVQYDQFTGESPEPGFGSILLFGIVSVGKTFMDVTLGTLSILISLPVMVLGIPVSVVSVIITWTIVSLIIGVWILYKLGG